MPQILVRNLDAEVRDRLRDRAAARGRSMEEEARQILRQAVMRPDETPQQGLGTRIASYFAEHHLDEPIQELRGHPARPADLNS